ncbi:MAG: class I SAM-dependent methyltransferase [Myxococcaceae bacterium]
MADPREFWNHRYAMPGWAYGTEPHSLVREVAPKLTGPVLCLGEGEGRNAVFLAQRGLDVTALDLSEKGLEKTRALAAEKGVQVRTVLADLATTELATLEGGPWGAVIAIWVHLPSWLRQKVHRDAAAALKPGGHLVLAAYTPEQLKFDTGGPKTVDLLYRPDDVRADLEGLEVVSFFAGEREVNEGEWHRGRSAVVEVVAQKLPLLPRRRGSG